jgi:hypothetical protein
MGQLSFWEEEMNPDLSLQSPETVITPGDYELGTLVGRRQAFSVVAGRASAADVDCLRQIRDSRLYRSKAATWAEFCTNCLGVSKAHVNRMIRCLEKYGPRYFALTQFTRVPPSVFETIAPHLTEEGLTIDGETFALSADNTEQIAAAVAELRKRAGGAENQAPQKSPFEVLEGRFQDLIGRLENLQANLDAGQKQAVGEMVARLASAAGLPLAA